MDKTQVGRERGYLGISPSMTMPVFRRTRHKPFVERTKGEIMLAVIFAFTFLFSLFVYIGEKIIWLPIRGV